MKQKDIQGKLWADQTTEKISAYWEYPNFAKRAKWLAEQLKQYKFESIFEVGLFSGRNLKIMKDAFPKIKIGGIDINETAIKLAKEKIPEAYLKSCSVYDMDIHDKWDIVFTMGVMIHIPPIGQFQHILCLLN
jgi:trans-aconitate methyltransferase